MGCRGRDVEVVGLDGKKCMVMACDSAGAIGDKELDIVKVPPYVVGRMTARVALLELLSVGARPQMLSATISCEPEPTGSGIMAGIQDELNLMGLEHVMEHIAISTEKNFETRQTGLGITVVGTCDVDKLRAGTSKPGDIVYVFGVPKVGNELNGADDEQIISGRHVTELLEKDKVHDLIPVGSKGIHGEIEMLCETTGCKFLSSGQALVDMEKSAGPSTCLIATASQRLSFVFGSLSVIEVGHLI